MDAAESLALSLDEGLLQQLQPIAQIHPYRLEAQVTPVEKEGCQAIMRFPLAGASTNPTKKRSPCALPSSTLHCHR